MAFSNTVKIQSDDDAPELYKETLPRRARVSCSCAPGARRCGPGPAQRDQREPRTGEVRGERLSAQIYLHYVSESPRAPCVGTRTSCRAFLLDYLVTPVFKVVFVM